MAFSLASGRCAATASGREPRGEPGARRWRELLALPHARVVVAAISLVGRLAWGTVNMSLLVFMRAATGRLAEAGLVVALNATGSAIVGPKLGRLLDRYGPRLLLPALSTQCGILFTLLIVAACEHQPLALLGALAILAGAAEPPITVVVRSWWWTVCESETLRATSNAWESMMDTIGYGLLPAALAAPLLAVAGSESALVAGVILTAVVPLAFAAGPILTSWRSVRRVSRAGDAHGRSLLRTPAMRIALACYVVFQLAVYMIPAAAIEIATGEHDLDLAGLLLGATLAGTFLGGLFYMLRTDAAPGRTLTRSSAASALALTLAALAAAAHSIWATAAILLVFGAIRFTANPAARLVVANAAPAGRLAEANSWMTTMIFVGSGAGPALGGLVGQRFGAAAVLLLAATLAATASALAVGLAASGRDDTSRHLVDGPYGDHRDLPVRAIRRARSHSPEPRREESLR